jgi:alkanesulfonate monooxygenase SsuD/methylene tetrahydromethanopterin reductase-like flavin-dependent oxidoreductase (luciferase family)
MPGYHEGWKAAGHPGRPDIGISIPLYVAETGTRARAEAEESMMSFFHTQARAIVQSDGASSQTQEARLARAQRLLAMPYEEVLREQAIFGSPEEVVDRLVALREELGYSNLSMWMNPGNMIPHERVLTSMRLFAERVMPRVV